MSTRAEATPGRLREERGVPLELDVDRVPPARGLHLGERAGLDDLPVVDEDDLVAELLRLAHLVRREEDRLPLRRQLLEQAPHEDDVHRVEAGAGLVEDDELGVEEEGAGQLDLLLVPLRELLHLAVPLLPELEAPQPALGGAGASRRGSAP